MTARPGHSPADQASVLVTAAEELAEPPQRLTADVVVEEEGWAVLGDIEVWVGNAARVVAVGRPDVYGTVVVAFDTDAAIRKLNKAYRRIDKPTNVLSFPSGEGLGGGHIGDVILARETVLSEAADMNLPIAHHVTHLVIHGLLHLIGYDHMTAADADVMEQLETRLLAMLDIPDPYAGTDPV